MDATPKPHLADLPASPLASIAPVVLLDVLGKATHVAKLGNLGHVAVGDNHMGCPTQWEKSRAQPAFVKSQVQVGPLGCRFPAAQGVNIHESAVDDTVRREKGHGVGHVVGVAAARRLADCLPLQQLLQTSNGGQFQGHGPGWAACCNAQQGHNV